MPSAKRLSDSHDASPHANKIQRVDSSDFSGAVKKKLSGANRTGQACDRCKVRKIRCDARPGGCSPCLQSHHECKTTDRITGRATSRGHTETVEAENDALKQHLADLRQQLQEHGIEPRPQPIFREPAPRSQATPVASVPDFPNPHDLARILNPEPVDVKARTVSSVLPEYRADSTGDNYLGASSSNEWPTPVGGTHHALFGMQIDLTDFVASEDARLAQTTSYMSFLSLITPDNPVEPPQLPPYEQARSMAEWELKLLNCWFPVLHKPHFLAMLDRFYHDPAFVPTAPEKTQFHLVLAIMLYQFSARNPVTAPFKWVDHYSYALQYYSELYAENSLPAIQALSLVTLMLRQFPRPGAVWITCVSIMAKAIEMGLHRSINAWEPSQIKFSNLDIEMRKRVFWSLLSCCTLVGTRLGRPSFIRLDDFDIELPEPLHDNLAEEQNVPEHKRCSFKCAITGFHHLIVQLQMYSSLYSIRPVAHSFEQVQKRLVTELEVWAASIPSEWKGTGQSQIEDSSARIYLEFSHQHSRLLIHHPSLCRNPALMANNLDICLDASKKLLSVAEEMRENFLLDTAWFNTTYLLAAMFTTLFANSERKDRLHPSELEELRHDMQRWVDLMGEIGKLLGSGGRLAAALSRITSAVLSNIGSHVAAKHALAAFNTNQGVMNSATDPNHNDAQGPTSSNMPYPSSGYDQHTGDGQSPYVQATHYPNAQYAYPDPAAPISQYQERLYAEAYDDIKPDLSQLAHSAAAAHQNSVIASPAQMNGQPRATHQEQSNQGYNCYDNGTGSSGDGGLSNNTAAAWRNFADTMTHSMAMNNNWPANALMSLGQQSHLAADVSGGSASNSNGQNRRQSVGVSSANQSGQQRQQQQQQQHVVTPASAAAPSMAAHSTVAIASVAGSSGATAASSTNNSGVGAGGKSSNVVDDTHHQQQQGLGSNAAAAAAGLAHGMHVGYYGMGNSGWPAMGLYDVSGPGPGQGQ